MKSAVAFLLSSVLLSSGREAVLQALLKHNRLCLCRKRITYILHSSAKTIRHNVFTKLITSFHKIFHKISPNFHKFSPNFNSQWQPRRWLLSWKTKLETNPRAVYYISLYFILFGWSLSGYWMSSVCASSCNLPTLHLKHPVIHLNSKCKLFRSSGRSFLQGWLP